MAGEERAGFVNPDTGAQLVDPVFRGRLHNWRQRLHERSNGTDLEAVFGEQRAGSVLDFIKEMSMLGMPGSSVLYVEDPEKKDAEQMLGYMVGARAIYVRPDSTGSTYRSPVYLCEDGKLREHIRDVAMGSRDPLVRVGDLPSNRFYIGEAYTNETKGWYTGAPDIVEAGFRQLPIEEVLSNIATYSTLRA